MFSNKYICIAILLTVSACAKQNLIQQRQRNGAPHSAQEVGTILEGAKPEQVNSILEKNPEAKIRVLNSEHGMYEVFNVDEEKVAEEFSGRTSRNQYVEFAPKAAEENRLFAGTAPAGLRVGNLPVCQTGPSPTAVITVQTELPENLTVEVGTKIRVNGMKSTPAPGDTAPLKMAIAVKFPNSATEPEMIREGVSLEIATEALGEYKVVVVAQSAAGVCSLEGIKFMVTANRPYNGPSAPDLRADLSKFRHLGAVHAQEAWQLAKGDGVTIAIVDSGVNYNHPSLAANIAVNKGEIPANKIDDDKNGFVDDVVGYDFANNDEFPYDDHSHGTHVAGLAASKQFGLAPNAKILPVKAMAGGGGDVASIAAGIRYAVDRKANIINLSLGSMGPLPHPAIVGAINYAEQKGVLVVVAAGNGDPETGLGVNIDRTPVWPAALKNDNILTVAASDVNNILAPYSNFGGTSVDVVAPGGGEDDPMVSCAFENPRKALLIGMSGTSMAAPVVAGIAADVWSKAPGLSLKDLKEVLIKSGTVVPQLGPVTVSGRHLDALSAVQNAAVKNVLF